MRHAYTVTLFLGLAFAQTDGPDFEVASVRAASPITEHLSRGMRLYPSGRLWITMFPLKQLISVAYDIPMDQVLGGPSWLDSDYFVIDARTPLLESERPYGSDRPTRILPQRYQLMLRRLLMDRFELRTHNDTRQSTVYQLALGKGGIKLKEVASNSNQSGGFFPEGRIVAEGRSMAWLADLLSRFYFHAPVQDRTGLTGLYNFTIEFENANRAIQSDTPLSSDKPLIFDAVAQIGLRLVSGKGPVQVLTIDHASKPSAN